MTPSYRDKTAYSLRSASPLVPSWNRQKGPGGFFLEVQGKTIKIIENFSRSTIFFFKYKGNFNHPTLGTSKVFAELHIDRLIRLHNHFSYAEL